MEEMNSIESVAMFGKMAMQIGNYPEALHLLSSGLVQLKSFNYPPHYAAQLLLERAECYWMLNNVEASLQDMGDALNHGLPSDGSFTEEESLKWSHRGQLLLQDNKFLLAEQCANFALYFRASLSARVQAHMCRAFAQYELGKNIEARNDINEVKRLDSAVAKSVARQTKDVAIKNFQNQEYQRSLKDFHLALLFHPDDSSKTQFKRSVESHQAAVYFRLKQYEKAVELGEKNYKSNPSYKSKEEADRWRKRGNDVSNVKAIANSTDLAIACYSLALNFVPSEEKYLKATIFSNRCLMYQKQEKAEEALQDAKQCVDNNPSWAKAQYRLGSCLHTREKYSEAMKAFSRSLQLLLSDSSTLEHRRVDTVTQLLSVAFALPGGTSDIDYSIPQNILQTVIDNAVAEKNWDRLHLLFMGGGGEKRAQKGLGGLGTGCDASSVPLEEVIHCDFPDLSKFISILMEHKASASPQKGRKDPLDVAIKLQKFDVVNMLMDRCNNTGASVNTTSSKPHKRTFKADGQEAVRKGDNRKAIELLQLSLKHDESKIDEQRQTLELLCELHFKEKSFNECLETGRNLKATYLGEKSEENDSVRIERANQWKKWGNEIHKESKYDLMAEYYTLAMEFTPKSNTEIMTALLSNRCLAFINLKQLGKALEDAKECIKLKPQWFRGHSRHGTCLLHLKQNKEALKAFCEAHTHALTEKENNSTANEVISTAMNVEGGESQITCNFSPQILHFLVKEASEKKEWKKLRFLYLGSTTSKTVKGVAFECNASCVPLDLIIESDIKDLNSFLPFLLSRGALPDGLKGCKRPPLLAAIEMMKFPLAVTLLRNKADPSCIVGHGTFINKEGQPRQWLHLGRKALENNDHRKAAMLLNMCIYLSDSSTDMSILTQAYHALGEAHFTSNEHERAIDAGKECFKLRPLKSEEEAMVWKDRAFHVFKLGDYTSCVECVNLALKYTPAESKRVFSLLLCQRSQAEQQLGNYTSGLEDARKASMMTPEMLEGYLYQFRCSRALKREREAMQAVNECLKRATDETLVGDLLSDALDIAVNLEEGTTAITAHVSSQHLVKLSNDVIKMRNWNKLKTLYLGGGGPSSQPVGGGGLAININSSSVPLGDVIRHFGSKEALISTLLEHGASANVIDGSNAMPLEEAMRKENLPLVEKLVQKGANCCVACSDGEPIVHKALRKGLKSGNFRFLKAMVNSKIPEIENIQDNIGDTLYHLVCAGKKCTSNKCDAIEILRNANINPNLPNNEKKYPLDMLNKSDSRWKMINDALKNYTSNTPNHLSSKINGGNTSTEEQVQDNTLIATERLKNIPDEPDLTGEKTSTPSQNNKVRKNVEKRQHRTHLRESIARLINAVSPSAAFVPQKATEEQEDDDIFGESSTALNITEHDGGQQKGQIVPKPTEYEHSQTAATEHEIEEDEMGAQIDSQSPFEDLPWEVDCTDRVWKVMRSKKVDNNLRRRIINKIRMLANGRWSKTLCKRLEGNPKKEGIQLYESKLTKGQRIIWEKTIAFSGRLSDEPENRLNQETSGGRIYSDIIRVWDIVLDHDKLERSIEYIVKSHDRGMDCLIKKKLKGITGESRNDSTPSRDCLPNKYVEIDDLNRSNKPPVKKESPKKPPTSEDLSQIFFPPASANDQEYHILKFYSFNTPLVRTVLESDTSTKVDFPFKITELEHAIVNLRPDPPAPIILLGRSGTGKTTCCLYRLWDNFQRYWENAVTAGPHIPKFVRPLEATERDDEVENPQGSSEQGACGQDRTTLTTGCQEFEDCADSCIVSTAQDDEESRTYGNSYGQLSQEESQCEGYSPDDISVPRMYEHLHQIFITKNTVLCSEVEKNFKELCRACPAAEQRLQFEDRPTPTKIQDVAEGEWPLFVNSRDWLLMLDASLPGETFFKRADDGSLERKIGGWGEEDNHLQFIPATDSDDESDDEEGEEETETENDNEEPKERRKEPKRDPRREITYQVFRNEIWPKMKKSLKEKIDYHPTLVWTEIRSFIKGSAEALMCDKGVLSLEDYESLGRKKAPNFTADRKLVYDLFIVYQREHSRNRMFDEADLVFNIHRRLQTIPAPEWSVHQFYVDETQDFTQAELSLLIRCCRFPDKLFFTGDTAQSIMRGIAFRFDDLKTLFYHAKKAVAIEEGYQNFIRVPKKLYQLTHNYRSHAGILHLASSVVDLLLYYFPDSFDRLQKDEGLFEGPRPVLLELCSPTDLALILQGNQRQSSRIEFGAHQVVLVASNEAREAMPDELKQGLVMTIYEAKGLEFDDVLIYNFFKDSQAGKEWRVVTSFVEQQNMTNISSSTGLTEITEESVNVQYSRPLEFDPEKHKVLNSEFKYLYTAITRARVNVWFFDEDKEARAPVFEYFRRLGLVQVVALEDKERGTDQLTSMFAKKSTPEEWRKGGMRFYKKRLWVAAIQCFTFAGDTLMLQKSQAQQQAAEAIKLRSMNRQRMRDEFLRAAESFLQCDMYDETEICLNNAREWILLAKLYEKTGKYQDAARLFKKKGFPLEASRCYESQNNYRDAIETLCQEGHTDEALNALERYNLSSSGDLEGRHGIIPPKSTRTVERLRHQLADQHFKRGNIEEMEKVLQHLPSTTDRITFLKKRGCIIEAARVMEKEGRRDEAARLLKDEGRFLEAGKYSSDPKFAADCLVSQARTTKITDDNPRILQIALEKYQQCNDISGQAEALLMLGKLSKETQMIQKAGRLFDKCKNCCGEVESVVELLKTTNYSPPDDFSQWITIRALERVLRLVTLLYKPAGQLSMAERREVEKCEGHFELFTTDVPHKLEYFCKRGGRFSRVDPEFLESNASKIKATIDTFEAHQKIGRFLIDFSVTLITMIRKMLENTFLRSSVCRKVADGALCDNSSCKYEHEDSIELFNNRFHALFNFIYLESVVEQNILEMTVNKNGNDVSPLINKGFREFHACQRFYSFLFPSSGCRRFHLMWPHVFNIRRTKAVHRRIIQFANFSWKEIAKEKRRSDTDNFLKVSSSLQLIGSASVMVRWICEEENEFQTQTRKSFKTTNDQLVKNGMVVKRDTDRCESYLQWWEDGKKRLYVHGDVENAAHLIIRRFLTLTAKRSRMVYPSIANTVMILEHQLTTCLALYTKLCTVYRYPICLPESYLTMVRLWDIFRPGVDKGTFTLYQAVENNANQEADKLKLLKAVCSVLNYMVKLTCGEVAPLFDVLGDALNSDDTQTYNASGEAERSLVLFLTMLCNCGKGISNSVEGILLRKIFNLKPNPCLSSRINNVLVEVQEAKGCSDIVAILNKFLQSRGEVLYDLRWHHGKLWYDGPSNPSGYPQRFHTDTSIIREGLKQDERQVEAEAPQFDEAVASDDVDLESEDLEATAESMEVKYTDEELKEKENARLEVTATTMQRLYRRRKQAQKIYLYAKALQERKLSRFKSIEEQTNASRNVSEDHFSRFKVDSSACGICGTNFLKASTDDYQLPITHEDNEVDFQENSQQAKESLPDEEIETAEAHKKSQAHFQKEEEFQRYKELYLAEILPCLMKEEELRKMVDDISSSGDKRRMEDVALDLERLETTHSAVTKNVQAIEFSLDWTNTSSLISAAKELGAKVQEIFKLLEQAKADLLTAEHIDEEETKEHEDENDEEGEEQNIIEMHQDGVKRRRKPKRKKR